MASHRDGLQSHRSRFTDHRHVAHSAVPYSNFSLSKVEGSANSAKLLTALIHTHRQANECVLRVWFCAGLVVPATDQVRLIKLDWIGAKRFCLVRLE